MSEFILYQYVGLPNGLSITYPAYEMCDADCYPSKTAFDPINRPWFSAAAVGPANIVILVDTSSSMNMFRRLQMMKDAVHAFINSIDDDSYLNVVAVNSIPMNALFICLFFFC